MTDAKIIYVDFKARRQMSPIILPNVVAMAEAGFDDHTIANVMALAAPVPETVPEPKPDFGSRYVETANLSCKELAKLIRHQLKEFQGFKFSVVTDSRHISVTIMDIPKDLALYNRDWVRFNKENPYVCNEYTLYSTQVLSVIERIEEIVDSYNYDKLDFQTDYFDTRFYSSVTVHWDCEKSRKSERD